MENYRKLASIVKTNDKTWGRLNEYIRAGDVTKP
jgi:hypothetical protein